MSARGWIAHLWHEWLFELRRPIAPAFARPDPRSWPNDRLTAAWLGHSTVLLNFFGVTILTDPVLLSRCGIRLPGFTIGPKRLTQPALKFRELPPIDLVLLSHAHFDHFDTRTLHRFGKRTQIVTAPRTRGLLRWTRLREITELRWGESHRVSTAAGDLLVRAFRVRHWGARMQYDHFRGYNGYVLERNGRRILFGGDTALTDDFAALSDGRPFDLALMGIGAYQPWIRSHCTPEEAIAMANAAGARFIMPVHHQTFKLSFEPFREPIERFTAALAEEPERIALREIGETFMLPLSSFPDHERESGHAGSMTLRRDELPVVQLLETATKSCIRLNLENMRAVVISTPGGVEGMALQEVETPAAPTADRVRVRVRAAGLNRADIMQREGKYPAPPGYPEKIPGLEFAGEVEAIGEAVREWKIGDRVFGITAGGAQAELVIVASSNLARIPDALDWTQAAAMPEVFITAHDALFTRGRLEMGERVLIHAAASGVGTAAVQLARAAGATVYGTSRTAKKLEQVRALGLDEAIVVGDSPETFVARVQELTGGNGVDVILDLVGGAYFPANLEALAPRGRLICVGLTAGRKSEIDLGLLLRKRATIVGTVLRARSTADKAEATRRFAAHVLPLVARGLVRPVIDRVYPAAEVREAHQHLESNRTLGKIILDFSL